MTALQLLLELADIYNYHAARPLIPHQNKDVYALYPDTPKVPTEDKMDLMQELETWGFKSTIQDRSWIVSPPTTWQTEIGTR